MLMRKGPRPWMLRASSMASSRSAPNPSSHPGQQARALLGQLNEVVRAAEIRLAEVPLERLNLHASSAHRDTQRFSSARELQLFGDRDKHTKAAQRKSFENIARAAAATRGSSAQRRLYF